MEENRYRQAGGRRHVIMTRRRASSLCNHTIPKPPLNLFTPFEPSSFTVQLLKRLANFNRINLPGVKRLEYFRKLSPLLRETRPDFQQRLRRPNPLPSLHDQLASEAPLPAFRSRAGTHGQNPSSHRRRRSDRPAFYRSRFFSRWRA